MTQDYPTGGAPGSNKVVATRPSAGASQRRDRPRPTARTAPASSSWRRARWTVRWLEPSAYATAEVDHDSPPSRRAMMAPAGPSIGGASTTTARPPTGPRAKPRRGAPIPAGRRRAPRRRPRATRLARGGGVRDGDAAERELGAGELGAGRERWRRASRGDADRAERPLGGRELADEELAAGDDEAGVEGVRAIAQRIERPRGRVERAHRPPQVARGEGDLRLGDLAARLGEALAGAEAAGDAPAELARPVVLAELGHGAAAQGEGRRVVAQRDTLEGAERVTGRQRARGRGDDGVHLVEDTSRSSAPLDGIRVRTPSRPESRQENSLPRPRASPRG